MPAISKSRRESILNSLPNICSLCGDGERDDDPWTLDHETPKALGGGNTRANLQKAHKFCNHLHGAKLHLAILEKERDSRGFPDVSLSSSILEEISTIFNTTEEKLCI